MQSHSSFQQNFQDIRNSTLYKTPEEIVSLAGVKQGDKPSKHSTRNAQAANFPFCTIDPNIGVVDVVDARLDQLAKLSNCEVLICFHEIREV